MRIALLTAGFLFFRSSAPYLIHRRQKRLKSCNLHYSNISFTPACRQHVCRRAQTNRTETDRTKSVVREGENGPIRWKFHKLSLPTCPLRFALEMN